MTWIEKKIQLLLKLRGVEEYLMDMDILSSVQGKTKEDMLDVIDYISSKYRSWINEIGAYHQPNIHVTCGQEEYDQNYQRITIQECVEECGYLFYCLVIGTCVKVGMYPNVFEALKDEEKYEKQN